MVEVLNINRGYNRALMEKCHRLWEYSEFSSWFAFGKFFPHQFPAVFFTPSGQSDLYSFFYSFFHS